MSLNYLFNPKEYGYHVINVGRDFYQFDSRTLDLLGKLPLESVGASLIRKMRPIVLYSFLVDFTSPVIHCSKYGKDGSLQGQEVKLREDAIVDMGVIPSMRGYLFRGRFKMSSDVTQFIFAVEV